MVLWHPGLQQYPYAIDVPVVCHDRADNGRDQYVFIPHLFPIRVLRYSVAVAAIAQIFYAWYVSRLVNVVVLESTGVQEDMGTSSELDPEDRRSSGRASTFVRL